MYIMNAYYILLLNKVPDMIRAIVPPIERYCIFLVHTEIAFGWLVVSSLTAP